MQVGDTVLVSIELLPMSITEDGKAGIAIFDNPVVEGTLVRYDPAKTTAVVEIPVDIILEDGETGEKLPIEIGQVIDGKRYIAPKLDNIRLKEPPTTCPLCHGEITDTDDIVTDGGDGYHEPVECGSIAYHQKCVQTEFYGDCEYQPMTDEVSEAKSEVGEFE